MNPVDGPTFEGPSLDGTAGVGALTLGGFLDEVVERFGPNEAVVFDDPLRGGETVRWSYDDLGREARLVGRALVASGVQPGETVAIVMANRPEALAALFGASLAGAVVAPVSTFSPRPELAHLLRRAGPRCGPPPPPGAGPPPPPLRARGGAPPAAG